MHYNTALVKEAIERELGRGGQVYIVHNRVRTIGRYKYELEKILPKNFSIGMAHGQMTETQLADTMSKFATNKYQILLATTIVENGLDLPNVNTLIVENASGLGLSQLYQLRGRVGRSEKKAYAYFLYRSDKLKNKAKQRLSAIAEATELGSGLKLAISDMEIRGVGNVLGVEQHGNAYAVGLGLFLDMLEETVDRLKEGEEENILEEGEILIDLPVDVYIPKHYIEDREESLYWEQRLAVQSKDSDVDQVMYEIQSKHTQAPQELVNFATMTKLKNLCVKLGIKSVVYEKAFAAIDNNGFIVVTVAKNKLMRMIEKLYKKNNSWVIEGEKIKIAINDLGKKWFEMLYQSLI
jgi:transcription-repair coupling factor (superfamily II helicase)